MEHLLVLAVILVLVMTVLTVVAAKTGLLRILDRRFNRRTEPSVPGESEELNDELVAVIAAAVTAMLDTTVRVRRIRLFAGESGSAWTSVGRLTIMASHSLARRKT